MFRALRPVPLIVLLAACGGQEQQCERARDIYLALAAADEDVVLPGATAEQQARLDRQSLAIKRMRTRFVPACLALPPEGQACIARLDEFLSSERQGKRDEQSVKCRALLEPMFAVAAEE